MSEKITAPVEGTPPVVEPITVPETTDAPTIEELQAQLTKSEASLAKATKQSAKANAESKARRLKLAAFEEADAMRRAAELSEVEKLQEALKAAQSQASEAQAQVVTMQKQRAFFAAADKTKLKWASEKAKQDAVALLDLSEYDADDMEKAATALAEDRPYLFKAPKGTPDIDARKRGTETPASKQKADAEAQIAQAAHDFGIE